MNNFDDMEGGNTFFSNARGGGKEFFCNVFETPQLSPHVYIAASLICRESKSNIEIAQKIASVFVK